MASIRDIARVSGVSVTTVSRVLNNHPYVTEEKREKVLAAMKTLDYIPNQLAVNLSRGKSHTIAFVIPYITNPYYFKLLKGAVNEASHYGYHIIVVETGYKLGEEQTVLEMLKHRSVDGIIFTTRQMNISAIAEFNEYGPIILMEKNNTLPYVYIDQRAALSTALHYLLDKGYRRIGYTLHRSNGFSALERRKAYDEIPAEYRSEQYIYIGALTIEEGMALGEVIAHAEDKPDALIVTNDAVSAGIFIQLQKHGLRIPDDIAIIAYENGGLSILNALTSIDLPLEQMGREAVLLALGITKENLELPFHLIERQST